MAPRDSINDVRPDRTPRARIILGSLCIKQSIDNASEWYLIMTSPRTFAKTTSISLGWDEFAMGLQIDSPNRRELSQNVRMASQSPRMHRELVANGSPKF